MIQVGQMQLRTNPRSPKASNKLQMPSWFVSFIYCCLLLCLRWLGIMRKELWLEHFSAVNLWRSSVRWDLGCFLIFIYCSAQPIHTCPMYLQPARLQYKENMCWLKENFYFKKVCMLQKPQNTNIFNIEFKSSSISLWLPSMGWLYL